MIITIITKALPRVYVANARKNMRLATK